MFLLVLISLAFYSTTIVGGVSMTYYRVIDDERNQDEDEDCWAARIPAA